MVLMIQLFFDSRRSSFSGSSSERWWLEYKIGTTAIPYTSVWNIETWIIRRDLLKIGRVEGITIASTWYFIPASSTHSAWSIQSKGRHWLGIWNSCHWIWFLDLDLELSGELGTTLCWKQKSWIVPKFGESWRRMVVISRWENNVMGRNSPILINVGVTGNHPTWVFQLVFLAKEVRFWMTCQESSSSWLRQVC